MLRMEFGCDEIGVYFLNKILVFCHKKDQFQAFCEQAGIAEIYFMHIIQKIYKFEQKYILS